MKNMIHNELELITALIEGGIPAKVAETAALVFSVTDMRKYVETNDLLSLQMCNGVGTMRAKKIVELLKDRIPAPMSAPCPDLKVPDIEMHHVPEMTLVYEDDRAFLSANKYKHGELALDKDGKPVKNIAAKRYGPALQKLQKITGQKDKIVFTTVSCIQEDYRDPVKNFEMEAKWHQIVKYGIKMPDGEIWIPGIMGTNARMKSQIHWMRLRDKKAFDLWKKCGANFDKKKVNIAKIEAYFGLLLPYTRELMDNRLNPSMEVFTPEWEHEHKGKNMLIEPNGSMKLMDTFMVPEFDGMLVGNITDELIEKMGLTRAEKRRLKRLIAKFKGGTIRAAWQKGVLVFWDHLHEALRAEGLTEWEGRPIEEIALWGDKTVFKASIGDDGLYEKFEDYIASFNGMQHRFGVLLENHGLKETFLPAQQLQAAHGGDKKFVEQGAIEEVEYLKAALDPKVAALRYEPNVIARIAQDDPSIMSTWFATEMACNGYLKEFKHALAGRTHAQSVTGFVIKDLVAFVQWIAFCAGVRKELPTGCLGARKVFAPMAGITGEAIASRNPVIANYGLPVVEVIDDLGEYSKWFDEDFPFIMVGIHDDLCKLLRMDHDGDKIRLTFAKWFIDLVKSINSDGVFAEWNSFGEVVKDYLTDETEREFFESCTMSSALGLNVDACGKMIANGLFTKPEHEWLADYMMNKGTDVKQGADGQNVGGAAGVIWNEMREANKNMKMSKAMAYGKLLKDRKPKDEDVAEEIGDDNLSIIHRAVKEQAPRVLSYTKDGCFDVHKVKYGKTKYVEGLVGGHKDKATGEWVNHLFNELVAKNKSEWAELDENMKTTSSYQDYLAWQKAQARKMMQEYAEANGYTMNDVHDTIMMYIFDTLRKNWYALKLTGETAEEKRKSKEQIEKRKSWMIVLARTAFMWFGDDMAEVYATNVDMGFLPAVDQPVELEEDIF